MLQSLLIVGAIAASRAPAASPEDTVGSEGLLSFGLTGGVAWTSLDPAAAWGAAQIEVRPLRHFALQADLAYRRGTDAKYSPPETFEDRTLGATVVAYLDGPREESMFVGLGAGQHVDTRGERPYTEKYLGVHFVAGVRARVASHLRLLGGVRIEVLPFAMGSERVDIIRKIFVGLHFSP